MPLEELLRIGDVRLQELSSGSIAALRIVGPSELEAGAREIHRGTTLGPEHADGALPGGRGGEEVACLAQTFTAPSHDQRKPPLVPESSGVDLHGLKMGKHSSQIAERDQCAAEPLADLKRLTGAVLAFGQVRHGDERLLVETQRFPIGRSFTRTVAGLS